MTNFRDAAYDTLVDDAFIRHSDLSRQLSELEEDMLEADPHQVDALRHDRYALSIERQACLAEIEILNLEAQISYFEHIGRNGWTLSYEKELLELRYDHLNAST